MGPILSQRKKKCPKVRFFSWASCRRTNGGGSFEKPQHTSKPSSRVSVNLRPLWSYLIAYTQGQKVSTPLLINSVWGSSYQKLCFTYKTILRMRVMLPYHISKYDPVKIIRHSSKMCGFFLFELIQYALSNRLQTCTKNSCAKQQEKRNNFWCAFASYSTVCNVSKIILP